MKYLPLIWYGIWRKRGRAILILFQIAIAFVLFGVLQGFKSSVDDTINKISANLYSVMRANGFAPLPMAMYERIKAVPGVKAVNFQSVVVGTYQNPKQRVVIFAANVETAVDTFPGLVIPSEAIAAMTRTRTGMIVSKDLAALYGWKVGMKVPLEIQMGPQQTQSWALDVVGIFEPGDQSPSQEFAFMNYSYFNEASPGNNNTVQFYYIKVDDQKHGMAIAQAIDKLFANSSDETRTESLKETVQQNVQAVGDLNFLIRAVVGAVLFALLFSVGAMMMQSIRERTPELAVLKTVGFSDRKVVWIVLAEVLTLCVVSAAIGLGLATLMMPIAKRTLNMELTMPISVLFIGAGLAVLLALFSAALPAWRGLRLQVVDALAGR